MTVLELQQFDREQLGTATLLAGGSKAEARRLWTYYSHRPAYQGVQPRLLGLSRIQLRRSLYGGGIYWLVYSDHVYEASHGP